MESLALTNWYDYCDAVADIPGTDRKYVTWDYLANSDFESRYNVVIHCKLGNSDHSCTGIPRDLSQSDARTMGMEMSRILKEKVEHEQDLSGQWIYCDERLPPDGQLVFICVVELNHGDKPIEPYDFFKVSPDVGWFKDHEWITYNDWDEGQCWAVVAWMPVPTQDTIKSHHISWRNN